MIRETSATAYKEINQEGIADTQKEKILYVLTYHKPLSLREIRKHTGYDTSSISGRLNDLKKEGKVKECTQRKCTVSGRTITPVTINNEPQQLDFGGQFHD